MEQEHNLKFSQNTVVWDKPNTLSMFFDMNVIIYRENLPLISLFLVVTPSFKEPI